MAKCPLRGHPNPTPNPKIIKVRFQEQEESLYACLEQSRRKIFLILYQKDHRSIFMAVMIGKSSNWLHVEFVLNAFLWLRVLT